MNLPAVRALVLIGLCLPGCSRADGAQLAVIEKIPKNLPPDIRQLLEATLSSDAQTRASAAAALGKQGPRAAPAISFLIRLLGDRRAWHETDENHVDIRSKVFDALQAIGEPAVEPLLAHLGDEDLWTRVHAAAALGRLKDPRAVEPMIAMLKEKHPEARSEAATALDRLSDLRAEKPLIAVLRCDKDATVRSAAASALGHREYRQAVKPLIDALLDGREDRDVRRSAAWSLGMIGDRQAVAPLLGLGKQQPRWVRKSVCVALGRLKDPRALQPLIDVLRDKNDDEIVRRGSAEGLALLGEPRGVEELIAVFNDKEAKTYLRTWIAKLLVEVDRNETIDVVRTALQDQKEKMEVRWWALDALAMSKNPRAFRCVIAALTDPDDQIRSEAVRVLAESRHFASDYVEHGEKLPAMDDPDVVQGLRVLAGNEKEGEDTRFYAGLALQRFVDPLQNKQAQPKDASGQ